MPLIEERGLTLVGVAVANLENDDALQLAMPVEQFALDAAVDEIRLRYGTDAVMRAVLVGRRPGWAMPLLPD